MLKLVYTPRNTDVIHAVAVDLTEARTTYCGRNALDWERMNEEQTEGAFVLSAWSCKACKKVIVG